MPRKPNTKPTTIYWLVDVRPETLTTRPNGLPFYCGKTIQAPHERLKRHKNAAERFPGRAISQRLAACANHVRIHVVEIVSTSDDWSDKEKRWIELLRATFPGVVNTTNGGQGAPGLIHSVGTRKAISAKLLGRKHNAARVANISAAVKGCKMPPRSPEHCAKIAANKRAYWVARRAAEAAQHA
jgi:hypothetical protein